jgi:LAO/AO transport system kinase
VASCVAARGEGVEEVLALLERHAEWALRTERGRARRAQRLGEELVQRLHAGLRAAIFERYAAEIQEAAEHVASGRADPYSASRALIERWTEPVSRA